MHVPDKRRGKLDPKAVEGFFVGLSENKRAYLIADSRNHLRLYESRNVTFVEDPQRPERVRIEVSEDHEDENDGRTLNDTTGPQPPEE